MPDYFIHETDQWLVFPHELDGLTREEMFANKPGLKQLFDQAGLNHKSAGIKPVPAKPA